MARNILDGDSRNRSISFKQRLQGQIDRGEITQDQVQERISQLEQQGQPSLGSRVEGGVRGGLDVFRQIGGLEGQKQPSALDDLVKLQEFQLKQQISQQKADIDASKEAREIAKDKREAEAIATAQPQADFLASEARRVSGQPVTPTQAVSQPTAGTPPTQVAQPKSKPVEPVAGEVQTEESVVQPATSTLQAIQQELGDTPLFLKSRKTTIDNTGKQSQVTSEEVNPLVLKALEAKLTQQGKLEDEERKLLFKGRSEQETNARSFDQISGLLENTVRFWRASAGEKEQIPIVAGSSKLRRLAEPVVSGLDIEGFPFTKAFVGQRIETAMGLSKIITGGSRIIKSVINNLLKTLPVDNAIEDDMKALVFQSFFNSATRSIGRELTPDEEQSLTDRVTQILETPPAELPETKTADKALESIKFKVNGVVVDVPADQIEQFFADPELTDEDIITRVE